MNSFFDRPEVARKAPLALLVYSLVPKLLGVKLPIKDSFHVGEWFAAATTLWNEPTSSPLTIHGGWDFIPAIATRWLAGEENYFYPTIYLTQSIIPAITAGILLLLLTKILKDRSTWPTIIFLSAAAIAAPNLVGIRDLFLVANCWVLYEFITHKQSVGYKRLIVLLVTTSSLGLAWSFDRGIAGLVTVLTTLLSAVYFEKKTIFLKTSALVVLGGVLMVLIIQTSGTMDYLYNVSFLAQTSSQWRYPLSFAMAGNSLMAIIFVATTVGATASLKSSKSSDYSHSYWLGIAACALMMLRVGINRPDMQHVYMAMWAPLILTAYSYSTRKDPASKPSLAMSLSILGLVGYSSLHYAALSGKSFTALAMSMSSALIWTECLSNALKTRIFLTNISLWILALSLLASTRNLTSSAKGVVTRTVVTPAEYLYKGVPYSRIADPGNAWAAKMIRDSGSKCLLDMTNSGIINAGADLPACIQASYPVYATKKFEDKLLREIENMDAKAIVYSSENRQYSIDGKDMKTRLPKVDALLRSTYPVEQCKEKYCIRSLQAMD